MWIENTEKAIFLIAFFCFPEAFGVHSDSEAKCEVIWNRESHVPRAIHRDVTKSWSDKVTKGIVKLYIALASVERVSISYLALHCLVKAANTHQSELLTREKTNSEFQQKLEVSSCDASKSCKHCGFAWLVLSIRPEHRVNLGFHSPAGEQSFELSVISSRDVIAGKITLSADTVYSRAVRCSQLAFSHMTCRDRNLLLFKTHRGGVLER